jgi:hypothetical protein
MTEQDVDGRHGGGFGRGAVEPLSPQAWRRVESAVFARLDAAAVPWSLSPEPLHSYAAPRSDRSLRLHWATSVGLALASAAAAASVLHLTRQPPRIEAGPPVELVMPAQPEPALPDVEPAAGASEPAPSPLEAIPPASEPVLAVPRPAAAIIRSSEARRALARPSARRELAERPTLRSDRERLFERAASLESADAPLALALYLSLASGDDDWAANALYAAGRLEVDRGLRDAGAEHLTEYLARFPRGENVLDVRGLRQRIGETAGSRDD